MSGTRRPGGVTRTSCTRYCTGRIEPVGGLVKFGRIQVGTPEGTQTRIVAAQPELERVVDLGRAYALTLQRRGATADAAVRVARALFPPSMAAALAAGPSFREAAEVALSAADDAATPINQVTWAAA